jgi:hypothetical protein
MDVDRRIAPITFWNKDRLSKREALDMCECGFGSGEYLGMSIPQIWNVDVGDHLFLNVAHDDENLR